MEVFLLWLALAFVAGVIADRKGRSGGWIFLLSLVVTPLIGIVIALVLQPNRARLDKQAIDSGDLKRCPYCAELIQRAAVKCKHCGSDVPFAVAAEPSSSAYSSGKTAAQ